MRSSRLAAILVAAVAWLSAGCGSQAKPAALPHGRSEARQPHRHLFHAGRLPASGPVFTPAATAVALAGKMPLARQVAQLFLVSVGGTTSTALSGLAGVPWGGVVLDSSNFVSDSQVAALAGAIATAIRSAGASPPLIAATQEGGADTALRDLAPAAEPAVGSSGQPALARSQAQLAGKQLRALGLNMTLAPLADVDTPQGALSGRLFSTDPSTVASFSLAAVAGYQAAGMISAVGHFPGSGGASADPDQMAATVGGSLSQLRERDLVPFAAVAPAAPVIVMSNASYTAFDGVTPASLLAAAVARLRREYRFNGVVMTDDLDATLQPTGSDPGSVAVQALQAGDDLLYITGPPSEHLAAYHAVLAAAQNSSAMRGLVYEAVLRVLTLKAAYKLLG